MYLPSWDPLFGLLNPTKPRILGEWSGVHPVSMDMLNSTIQWSKPHAGWRYRKGGVIHLPNLKDIFTRPNFQWVSTGCPIVQPTSIVMVHGNWMDFDCSSPAATEVFHRKLFHYQASCLAIWLVHSRVAVFLGTKRVVYKEHPPKHGRI